MTKPNNFLKEAYKRYVKEVLKMKEKKNWKN